MGITVEFSSDLALRDISEFKSGNRKIEECIPENMIAGETYSFLKKGQRLYWFKGEVPLLETKGNEVLSKPKASILLLEATHFLDDKETWTKGKYKVVEVFTDDKVHFDGFFRVGTCY